MKTHRWLGSVCVVASLVTSCSGDTPANDATRSRSVVSLATGFVPTGIEGRWRFEAISGVPPAELPPGAMRDNRHDLVVDGDGTFVWSPWTGTITGAGSRFALDVTAPPAIAARFDDYGASISILLEDRTMHLWLPDLGRDRDVDIGSAVEDIDSPDMAFVPA